MTQINDWTVSFRESFRKVSDLYSFLDWSLPETLTDVEAQYPIFVPKKLAQKIKRDGPKGVLARQFLPDALETSSKNLTEGLPDPIGDEAFHKAPELIHRYRSRALFTPTTICPVLCRYCFRKNELDPKSDLFQKNFEETLNYLRSHPEISELIFTGGDPLTLTNEKLSFYLEAFSNIPSLKDIRFHTRYPVILPERIDQGLLEVLEGFKKKFRTLSIAIHTNHKNEICEDAQAAITKLSLSGVQLLSQTVLLKGVNDNSQDLLDLMNLFLDLKIRPYYLHHPDQVKGGLHFYLSLEKGRSLYQGLRNHLPGWALPHYVIDIPGGAGKISAFNPETLSFQGKFLTIDGRQISLKEPESFI